MGSDSKKPVPTKQLIILGALFLLLLSLITYMLMDGETEESIPQVNQPVEVQASSQPIETNQSHAVAVIEGNATELGDDQYLDEDIDSYFITKAPKASDAKKSDPLTSSLLPKLPAANNGAVVTLPSLTPPSQLPRGGVNAGGLGFPGAGNIVPGMPTQITLPQAAPNYQFITINGIACNESGCRASTSNGLITKGSSIGGGNFASEKVESVTMNGIKTDKRFISY